MRKEYKSMWQAEQERKELETPEENFFHGNRQDLSKSFKRGFGTINSLKRSIVLATTSEEALYKLDPRSRNYEQTLRMLTENLDKANRLVLSLELEYRNAHHAFKEGGYKNEQ